MGLSKRMYEDELNEFSPPFDSEEWIIGGKKRTVYAANQKYGSAIRKHDPIQFEVAFNDWKKKKGMENELR